MGATEQHDVSEVFSDLEEVTEAMEGNLTEMQRAEIDLLIREGQLLRGDSYTPSDQLSNEVKKKLGSIVSLVENKLDEFGLETRRLKLQGVIRAAYAEGNNPVLD